MGSSLYTRYVSKVQLKLVIFLYLDKISIVSVDRIFQIEVDCLILF